MAKKSWGGAGAWAADAELAESEEVNAMAPPPPPPPPSSSSLSSTIMDDAAFPSLVEAASAKVSKKKKPQAVPFAKFMAAKPSSLSESKGLTYEDMVMLPTGPRDRSGEEIPTGGLGGGFRDYGGYRGSGGDRDRDRDGGGRRSSDREGGGFGRESGFGRDSAADEPSRADNAEDWGASKKFVPSGGGGGGGGGRYDDDSSHGRRRLNDFPSSKADEDSHWGSSKKFLPPSSSSTSSSSADRRSSKYDFSARNGTDSSSSVYPKSAVDEVENWASAKRSTASSSSSSSMAPGYYDSFSSGRDKDFGLPRDRDGADADKWVKSRDRDASRPLSSSGDRERERPRLVLQPRTQQPSSDTAVVAAVGKDEPAPAEDTQPGSGDTAIAVQKPARKVNPFGEAKPREVVLEEKGVNWKKHLDTDADNMKSVDRTSEELKLKEEIRRIEDAIKEKEGERKGKENDDEDEDEDAEKAIAELKAELSRAQEKLENLTLSSAEKKENGRANDVWSRNSSNGRHSVMPQERRGGRW